jgi:phage shock protein PspC (stress-responsive transcriptional regulator)
MRSLNIQREPGWIGGVATGIATRLGIDPLIVRGIIVVVAILGGPALLVYAAAWLLLPDLDDKIHLEQVFKGNLESPIAGIGVLVLLSMLPVSQGFWFAGSAFWGEAFWGASVGHALWTLVILGLAIWLVVWIARRPGVLPTVSGTSSPAPPPPPSGAPAADFAAWREQQAAWKAENTAYRQQRNSDQAAAWRADHEAQMLEFERRRSIYREIRRRSRSNPFFSIFVIGIALIAGGLTALSLKGGVLEVTTVVAGLAVALAVLALGMIVNGLRGKRPGGAAGLAALVVIPLIFFTGFPQSDHFRYANGATFVARDAPDNHPDVYVAGGGQVMMNLADYYANGKWDSPQDDIYLFVLSGRVTVILPSDAPSAVDANVLWGGVQLGEGAGERAYEGRGHSTYLQFNEPGGTASTLVTVHIYVLSGTITITDPKGLQ